MAAASSTLNSSVGYSQANTIQYAFAQLSMNINTVLACKILEVTGNTYTIQPLNNTLDANKKPVEPPKIYNIPYAMEMGGDAGVIIQLKVNDSVLVGFCQRDISIIKKSWTTQNPGSFRKFSLADGIIIKKLSNTLPSVFVKITDAGVEITAPDLPVTTNCKNSIVNATESAEVNSPDIKLGDGANLGVLLENTPLVMNIPGVQPGSGVTGVTATVTAGGSTIVKGKLT